jgi:small subunit ribosomal protein S11
MSEETPIKKEAKPQQEATPTPQATAPAPEGAAPAAPAEGAAPARPAQPTAADLLKADLGEVVIRRAKGSKNIVSGVCHILATFNNTKVAFTDKQGNVLAWSSSGKMHFRGSRKSTAYAAQLVTQDAGRVAMSHGLKEVEVHVKGPGMGRDSAIRAIQALGLNILNITDVTPVPHNGCRPPKRRRV